jgi:Ca2+-binding RTX toxin-like protein
MAIGVQETGTGRRDRWKGTGDDDSFNAGAGNDLCVARGGNDRVNGQAGGDDIKGGAGNDTLLGGQGDDTINGNAGNDRINAGGGDDTANGGSGNDRVAGGAGDDNVSGGSGSDTVLGGIGNDVANGDSGTDQVSGGAGNDTISGGADNDTLDGGDGNDVVIGNTGDDRMIGGTGDDFLGWADGDGNDIMSGDEGRDTIGVIGSLDRGDNFTLETTAPGVAFFQRTGLDGQAVGPFDLTVDTSEIFNVDGAGGDDTFVVNDLTDTGVEEIIFSGGEGNDLLDASNSSTHMTADGGAGNDTLAGGTGTLAVTRPGNTTVTLGDTLTGGTGQDQFQFLSDAFAGGVPGQNVNQPDVLTDYAIGEDQIALSGQQFGLNALNFQSGNSGQLSGDSNLLVLTDPFANAGLAAAAIAANPDLSADRGVFVYFNTTLGFSRVVFSENLADGGRFSVLGNLTNQTNPANQANFTANDFSLV